MLTFARDWSAALATSTAARAVCFGAVMSSPDHGASSYEVIDSRPALEELFAQLDGDSSGNISLDELEQAMKRM